MEATPVRFSAAVRALGLAARSHGLVVPTFLSPPRVAGVDRTVRRRADGPVVVAVRRRGRPFSAVVADLVEGVVVANGLEGAEAGRARAAMWTAVDTAGLVVSGVPAPGAPAAPDGTASSHAGRVSRRRSLRSADAA